MSSIFGVLLCFFLNISVVPQIYKSWLTKQVDDLSLPAYWTALLGFVFALLYCWFTSAALWLWINYIVGLTLELIMLWLIYHYRKP